MINLKLAKHRIRFSMDFISFAPVELRGRHLVSLNNTISAQAPARPLVSARAEFEYEQFQFDWAEISSPV